MATTTKTLGFGLNCPLCGGMAPVLSLDLNNLDEVTCGECSETFSAEAAALKAHEQAHRWDNVVRWIDQAGEMLAAAK